MSKTASLSLALLATVCVLPQALAEDEPAIEGDEAVLPYLKAVHAKVHPLWADNFLLLAASQLPKDHAINDPSRRVVLDVVLSASGALLDARVAKPSGASEFDSSATEILRAAGEFPRAPEAVLSDDGKAHLTWTLARNDRRCAGLALARHEVPLVEAVRALVGQGRDKLAVARLQAADDNERVAGMDVFARAWLDRNENGKDPLDVQVALANALAGDHRGAERLRQALTKAAVSDDAPTWGARGLAALGIATCPLIKAAFAQAPDDKRSEAPTSELTDEQFLHELQAKGKSGSVLRQLEAGADGVCLALAIATAKDRAAKKLDRLAAVRTLAHGDAPEVQAALKALEKDPDPAILAAVIVAQARPSSGRGAVFRLTPLLRDKSAVVRAAAAAALVRVGGEEVLPQLFQIYREKDPSIFTAVTAELARLSGAASAEMLGRFLKKDAYAIRVAAARALAARHDEHAAKLQATLAAADRPELQLLAGLSVAKEKREATLRALGDSDFSDSYAALLQGRSRVVAAEWLLLSQPPPGTRAEQLGQWLATRPKDK